MQKQEMTRFSTLNSDWADFMSKWDYRLSEGDKKKSKWTDEAERAMRMVTGKQWEPGEVEVFGAPVTNADVLSSTIDVQSAAIFNKDPQAIVFPKDGNFENAELVQSLLNYYYREISLKSTVKNWVISTLVLGQGFVKMGVTTKVKEIQKDKEKEGVEIEEGKVVSDYSPGKLTKNTLWVDLVDSRNMILDPSGHDELMRDCRWIAEKQRIGLDQILEDNDLYPPARKEGLVANLQLDLSETNHDHPVTIWEVYDKRTDKMYVLAQGHDQPLREEDYDFSLYEQFPYERLVFRLKPFTQYVQSDVTALIGLQKSLNKVLSTVVDHSLRHKTIFLAEDSISDQKITEIRNAAHGDVKRIPNINAMKSETLATLSPELITALDQILTMLREQTGISDFMRGGTVRGVQSATEAAIISQGDQLRLSERREILEVGLRNIGRYIYKLIRWNFKKNVLVPIDPRAGRWEKVSPEVIRGEYDIQVETGFISPLDKSLEITRQTQVLNALMPFIEGGIVKIRPVLGELLKSQGSDPAKYLLTDEESDQLQQQQEAIAQLQEENEQLKQLVQQTEAMLEGGQLQLTEGEQATAIPIAELQEEVAEASAEEQQEEQEESNPLMEE